MNKVLLILFFTSFSHCAFSIDFYIFGDLGLNKSITQRGWSSQFKPMQNYSFGTETHIGAERNTFLIGLKYNVLFSKVEVAEQNNRYNYKLGSGNGFNHISFYLGRSIYYKRKKKTINQIFIKSSIDYWSVFEQSYSFSFTSLGVAYGINWASYYADFEENAIGAGLQIQYSKAFWSKKGRKYRVFGEASINFVSLPELGISWQINNNAEHSLISKHTPLHLNIGIAKRILKPKHAL